MIKVRTMFVAVPLAAVLTAAAAVVIITTPWAALPGVCGGMVTAATGSLAALGHRVTEPEGASVTAGVLDTTAVVELPVPAETPAVAEKAAPAEPGLSPHEPNEPIDYSRLNTDVRVVTDTLERFNQKLLRMIAQAKAAHDSQPAPPAPPAPPVVDAAASVALDAPVTAAETPDAAGTGAELKQ